MRTYLGGRKLLGIPLIHVLIGVELIGDRIVDIALTQVRHDLQCITMTFVEELHLRKALTELGLLVVLTTKLLYIERRTIETIEVLLIEDEIVWGGSSL